MQMEVEPLGGDDALASPNGEGGPGRGRGEGDSAGSYPGSPDGPKSAPDPHSAQGRSLSNRLLSDRSELAKKLKNANFDLGVNSGGEVGGNEVFNPPKTSPSGGHGSKCFPPAYNIIRAGKAMRLNASKIGSTIGFERLTEKVGYLQYGLASKGDGRTFFAQNYHCNDVGLNMSISVGRPAVGGTDNLPCLACEVPHSFADSIANGKPVVIVLSDQNFPAILPARVGDCVAIIRVEDGLIHELERALLDRFKAFLSPHGSLPTGSAILVGSLSHLHARGLADYANSLVSLSEGISTSAGSGTRTIPLVNLPIGSLDSPRLIRALIDLEGWLSVAAAGTGTNLPATRKIFWEQVRGGGEPKWLMPLTRIRSCSLPA